MSNLNERIRLFFSSFCQNSFYQKFCPTTDSEFPDAFGHALTDYYLGVAKHYHIERDDGYLEAAEIGQYFTEYENWNYIERRAMDYIKSNQIVRGHLVRNYVLDVGCGAGRHALFLQKQLGLNVIGLDISPLALEVCGFRGLDRTLLSSITEVGELIPDLSINFVIMMCHNFGLFGNLELARKLLKKFYSITSQNGKIIASTRNPYITNEATDSIHCTYHESNLNRGRMAGQIRFRIRYQNLINPYMDYLFVSEEELSQILDGTGWLIEKIIYDLDETKHMKPSYIAVLTKKIIRKK